MGAEKNQFEGGRKKYIWTRIGIGMGLVLLLWVGGVILYHSFEITAVEVEGNVHYTDEQIEEIVTRNGSVRNSILLSLQYRNKSITDVPFVERMDVSVKDRHTVCVNVYEKALAGYVKYLGTYVYFDKDGIVVENSSVITRGIPEVTGLKFNHVILHEPLPVENEDIFQKILNMTNLLNKYEIEATKIYFDSMESMTLYFNDVRVIIGDEAQLDEKIMRLSNILPSLEGKSGVLHMETYSDSSKDITFESDRMSELETNETTGENASEAEGENPAGTEENADFVQEYEQNASENE